MSERGEFVLPKRKGLLSLGGNRNEGPQEKAGRKWLEGTAESKKKEKEESGTSYRRKRGRELRHAVRRLREEKDHTEEISETRKKEI